MRSRFAFYVLRALPLFVFFLLGSSILWPFSLETSKAENPYSLRITDREGGLLREIRPNGRGIPVSLADINPVVVQALVATEDRNFYRHPGIDVLAVIRAGWSNLREGTIVSGASTLTMQVARTLRGQTNRTLWDKLAEMHLALRLETSFSKQDILALWLNRVPFGNQTYGIEAASQLYFGKSALDLSLPEATYLVGLPQSPSRYNPFRFPDRARARQQHVLASLQETGMLDKETRQVAESLPLSLQQPTSHFHAPHYVQQLKHIEDTSENLIEIRSTIDPVLQQDVAVMAKRHVARLDENGVSNAAALVLDNESGEVLAYLGSVDFWDERAGGQNDGVRMLRQPGSALKPFTYALALSSRSYAPSTILADIETPVLEAGGAFSPQNYDETYHGPVPLRQALACSYNVPAVRLAWAFGPDKLLHLLHQAGFASLNQPADHYGVGLTLGNGEVQLLELARAYAGLARGGSLPELRFSQWQRTQTGDTLLPPPPTSSSMALLPEVVFAITDILSDPDARAPAFGRGGPLELPFPTAVKTGTSKDYRDNWAVGYTPKHTVAVWAGNFNGAPMRWVSGVTGAGSLLKAIFLRLRGSGPFEQPDGLVTATICPLSGHRPSPSCPTTKTALFLEGTVPDPFCNVHQRIQLDRRTGLLAGPETPGDQVKEDLFTVYPPLFHAWMHENGLPLPPPSLHTTVATSQDTLHYSDQLQIQYPEDGTVFQLDPILRSAYQVIHLKGSTTTDLYGPSWWVDGEQVGNTVPTQPWQLAPGKHTIELRAIQRDGQHLRSRPSMIRVIPNAPPGDAPDTP